MTIRENFVSLSQGKVRVVEDFDSLESFIREMFNYINPVKLVEEMQTCKMMSKDNDEWDFKFTPMAQISFSNTSCCKVSVGFSFKRTMKKEHALQKFGTFDTNSSLFRDNFLVILDTNVLNLEEFFKRYESQIFYVNKSTGNKDVHSDAFFKDEACTVLNTDSFIFDKTETYHGYYKEDTDRINVFFVV